MELKNGETYNGHLVACDNWMNINLREVICTSRVSQMFVHVVVVGQLPLGTIPHLINSDEICSTYNSATNKRKLLLQAQAMHNVYSRLSYLLMHHTHYIDQPNSRKYTRRWTIFYKKKKKLLFHQDHNPWEHSPVGQTSHQDH